MVEKKNPPFVPSPLDVVSKMLSIVDPKKDEILVDLGAGDGRILFSAARDYGCRAIGVEINPRLIEFIQRKISSTGLKNIKILRKNFYTYDFSEADIVTLYLLPENLRELKPRLLSLKRGSRIVSHDYRIPGIRPDEVYLVKSMEDGRYHKIYLYIVK
ncbi:MAG: class I SAM-dependent methyltransferase [Nitrososphaerota archaeon]|nr:class I SAM-dependent methyltransferase [Candidatus Geocrenenecus dongiae]